MTHPQNPSRPDPYSARYTPAPTPIGTPINAATPTMIAVPTMALATPPADCPAGTGLVVKGASSIDWAFFTTSPAPAGQTAAGVTNPTRQPPAPVPSPPCLP